MSRQKNLSAQISIGGTVSSTLTGAFGKVKDHVGQVGGALRKLEAQQRLTSQAIQTMGRQGLVVDGLRAKYVAITTQVEKLRAAHERLNRIQGAQQANQARRGELRGQMFDAVAVGGLAAAPIKIAADAEGHDLDMAKQLDGARDAAGKLTPVFYNMVGAVDAMAKTMPVLRNEIADTVTNSLKMGVSQQDVLGFTRSILVASSALGLSAADTADQVAKIGEAYGRSATTAGDFLDRVNLLDDKTTATATELLDFSQRFAGVGKTVGMSAERALAWGGTLLSVGTSADVASTALSKLFGVAAQGSSASKGARRTMEALGFKPSQAGKGMTTNADGTISAILDRIAAAPKDKQVGLVVDLVGQDHLATVLKLLELRDKLADNRKLVTSTEAVGSAQREYDVTLTSTNKQLTVLQNRTSIAAKAMGTALLPAVNDTASGLGSVVEVIGNFASAHPNVTRAVVGTVVAVTSLRVATLAGGYAWTFYKGGALQVAGVLGKVRAQMALTSASSLVTTGALTGMARATAASTLAMARNPIGLALVAASVAAVELWRHWDLVTASAKGFVQGVGVGLQPVVQTFRDFAGILGPIKPALDLVATGAKAVWDYFAGFLEPVKASEGALATATSAGQTFGTVVGKALSFALTPLQLLVKGITWIGQNAGSILDGVGTVVRKAKSVLPSWAGGGEEETGTAATGTPALPAIPAPRGATGGNVTNTIAVDLKVENAAGLDEEALARKLQDRIARGMATGRRSSMLDGALTQ